LFCSWYFKMKKLFLYAFLLLLITGCGDREEKAFNNCVDEVEGTKYKGKVLDEFGATVICQELKKKMPDMFRRSEGKILNFLTNR